MAHSDLRMLSALMLLWAGTARAQFSTTEVSGPGSPTPLRATAAGWEWEDIPGVTYCVHRSSEPSGAFVTVLSGHPAASWSGDGDVPAPGGCFHYLVTAFDGSESNLPGDRSDGVPRSVPACGVRFEAANCAPSCGTPAQPEVFGIVDEDAITLVSDGGGNPDRVMRIAIPRVGCGEAFSITQLEFELAKSGLSGDDIPSFVSGRIVAGLQGGGVFVLPDPVPFEIDEPGEADLDGSDGRMRLRWHDGFCPGASCAYPLAAATLDPLVVELTFAAEPCDVLLEAFNFRAYFSLGGPVVETLCSQRAALDPDPADVLGPGRGPAAAPEISCNGCPLVGCADCQCPLGEIPAEADIDMDLDPMITLSDDLAAGPHSVLRAEYFENSACESPQCGFELSAIDLRVECDSPVDCIGGFEFIPLLMEPPRLVHGDGSSVTLPWPAFSDEGDPVYAQYGWQDLRLGIVDGETFMLEFLFDTSLDVARITRLDLRVGGALPSICTAGGQPGGAQPPLCRLVSPFIDLGP